MKSIVKNIVVATLAVATTAGAFAQSTIIRSRIDAQSRIVYNEIPEVAPRVAATPVAATPAATVANYNYSYTPATTAAPAYNYQQSEAARAAAYAAQTEAAARAAAEAAAKPIDLSEFGVEPFVYTYTPAAEGKASASRMAQEARTMLAEIAALRSGSTTATQQQPAAAVVVAEPAQPKSKKEKRSKSAESAEMSAAQASTVSSVRSAEVQMREAQAKAAAQQLEIYEKAAAEQRIAYEKALSEQRYAEQRTTTGATTATATESAKVKEEKAAKEPKVKAEKEAKEPKEAKVKAEKEESQTPSIIALGYQHVTGIDANAVSLMFAKVKNTVGYYLRAAVGRSYNSMDKVAASIPDYTGDVNSHSLYGSAGGGVMLRFGKIFMPYVGVMGVANKFGYAYEGDGETVEYCVDPLTRFMVAPEVGLNLQFGRINANVGAGYVPGTSTEKYSIQSGAMINAGVGLSF